MTNRRFSQFPHNTHVVYDTDPQIDKPVYGGTFSQCLQFVDEMEVGGCCDYMVCANPTEADCTVSTFDLRVLRPCPFCGRAQNDTVGVVRDCDGWAAGCTDNCRIVFSRPTVEQAITAWNTRAGDKE